MKIGNTVLEHGLMLAPLAGFTNSVFRDICTEYGAEHTTSEMISAKAVCYGDKKTLILARNASAAPMSLQLFGADPEFVSKAIRILSSDEYLSGNGSVMPCAYDINMGCPVHKIVSNGEGSALMRDPVRAAEIVAAAVEASPVPITVKIRAGFSHDNINAPEFAEVLASHGASMICVHARTREQMYQGKADPEVIKRVKEAVCVPVVGNGDICSADDAVKMMEYTGCDGVMIGRGALGHPWIFTEIKHRLDGQEYVPPSRDEIARTAKKHISGMCRDFGEKRAVAEARKAVSAYVADFHGAAAARARINSAATEEEVCEIIDGVLLGK